MNVESKQAKNASTFYCCFFTVDATPLNTRQIWNVCRRISFAFVIQSKAKMWNTLCYKPIAVLNTKQNNATCTYPLYHHVYSNQCSIHHIFNVNQDFQYQMFHFLYVHFKAKFWEDKRTHLDRQTLWCWLNVVHTQFDNRSLVNKWRICFREGQNIYGEYSQEILLIRHQHK